MVASIVSVVRAPAMSFVPCSPHAMISSVAGRARWRFPVSLQQLAARKVHADVARLHCGAPSYHPFMPRDRFRLNRSCPFAGAYRSFLDLIGSEHIILFELWKTIGHMYHPRS